MSDKGRGSKIKCAGTYAIDWWGGYLEAMMGEAKATVFKEKDRFTIAPARTQCRRRLEDPGASRLVPAGLTNPIQVPGYTPRPAGHLKAAPT